MVQFKITDSDDTGILNLIYFSLNFCTNSIMEKHINNFQFYVINST